MAPTEMLLERIVKRAKLNIIQRYMIAVEGSGAANPSVTARSIVTVAIVNLDFM